MGGKIGRRLSSGLTTESPGFERGEDMKFSKRTKVGASTVEPTVPLETP
jgi:hypothetical protein